MSSNPGLIKSYKVDAAVEPYRAVKFGTDDNHVAQGTAVTESLIGVSDSIGADAAEASLDVIHSGIAEVEYGGTVTRGALLTIDSNGKAVAAAPAAGVNNSILGRAMMAGVSGDIGSVLLLPGQIQGA